MRAHHFALSLFSRKGAAKSREFEGCRPRLAIFKGFYQLYNCKPSPAYLVALLLNRAPHSPFLQKRLRANAGALTQKRGFACASYCLINFCAFENRTSQKAHPNCRIHTAYGKRVNFCPKIISVPLKGQKEGENAAENAKAFERRCRPPIAENRRQQLAEVFVRS